MKLGTRPGAKEQTPAFKWATGFCITQCKTGSDVNTHDYPIFCQEAKAFHQLSPWNIQKRHLTFTSLQRAFPSLHKELYTKLLGQLSTVSLWGLNFGSHQCPVTRVPFTLQCLQEHLSLVCIPPGWYITPGSWDGRGLPYSEQSLGTFSPILDSIPSCIFTILCSRAAELNELMLDWKSQAHIRMAAQDQRSPCHCTPGAAAAPWPSEGTQGRQLLIPPQSLLTLCLPGLEVVTSYLIIIPSRLFLLHLQPLHECRRCCAQLCSRAHNGTITSVREHKLPVWPQAAGTMALPSFSTKQVTSLLFTTISFYSLPPSAHFITAGKETYKPSLLENYST